MDIRKNIFIKPKKENKLLDDIEKTIPSVNYNEPQPNLAKIKTEWRWRYLTIDGNVYIEISKKIYGKDRLYINNDSQWVHRDVSKEYDKYVTSTVYAYL
jgi:hypothetical protein